MVPPTARPLPRFVAEPPHELEPYGRWAEVLGAQFAAACERIEAGPQLGSAAEIEWFPERSYGGRTYVPAVARLAGGEELFGYVSFTRSGQSEEASGFATLADYTEETAERNPGWKLDLNDEVISGWRGPEGATGELTLVWGRPLVPGGAIATAELAGETVDQCALGENERFTLVALDAVKGIGEELYLEVRLWNKRGEAIASESLYEDEEEEG